MMDICFATNNENKLKEIQVMLGNEFNVLSLKSIGHEGDVPEEQATLEGNSRQKAEFIYENYQVNCFADDTGLEVYSLDGDPGVLSARYAGEAKDANDNMALLLKNLEDRPNRKAQFRTVVTLIRNGKTKQFEGIVKGKISEVKSGAEGFGYDPIFIPNGYDITFAEMSMDDKNAISHRGRAIRKLVDYLKNHAV